MRGKRETTACRIHRRNEVTLLVMEIIHKWAERRCSTIGWESGGSPRGSSTWAQRVALVIATIVVQAVLLLKTKQNQRVPVKVLMGKVMDFGLVTCVKVSVGLRFCQSKSTLSNFMMKKVGKVFVFLTQLLWRLNIWLPSVSLINVLSFIHVLLA